MTTSKPILAITMGDPGGIGPEVIAKSLQDFKYSEGFYYLLIGAGVVFDFLKEELGLELPLHPIPTLEASFLREDSINFLDISEEADWLLRKVSPSPQPSPRKRGEGEQQCPSPLRDEGEQQCPSPLRDEGEQQCPSPLRGEGRVRGEVLFDVGKVSEVNAALAFAALKVGAFQAATGLIEGLITTPVNKTAIRLMDPRFQGHTEYLAKVSRTPKFAMMFVSDRLKVTLATLHVPLKKVSRLITEELILDKIRLTDEFLKNFFRISKPVLAVCALNPHGKETGEEEEKVILPALRRAQAEKIEAIGPLSADQLFHDAYEGRFDAVISMYHDQGLAPFKMIAFREGVNVTLGLPYVRTSPDHGTAFDIAYQGKADPSSMKAALALAEKLALGHPSRTS